MGLYSLGDGKFSSCIVLLLDYTRREKEGELVMISVV